MTAWQALRQHLSSNSLLLYCIQIAIVLSGTTLGLYFLDNQSLIVPVTLGAIAAALTDFDDRLSIRLRNLIYVCVLFFAVSSLLSLIYPYKILFVVYFSLSSAALILLGALGQRYAVISFGAVLLSIYTLFGIGEYPHWSTQASYFVLGALYYGLSSIIFYLLKPTQALQDNLAQSFSQIADLLYAKARLFDPDNYDNVEQLLYTLSQYNTPIVHSLNQTKRALLTRLKASRANATTIYWLDLYFLAQDLHEHASSNFVHYQQLQTQFSRSDLIYRIQKNIRLLAQSCQHISQCILHRQNYQENPEQRYALTQLEYSMQDWISANPKQLQVKNLKLILNNLTSLQEQLQRLSQQQSIESPKNSQQVEHLKLLDDDIQGLGDLWLKLKQHLNTDSALFRHAVRIAVVFLIGNLISLLPITEHGYWILLTSLFVCQTSYFATKSRLKLRTLGTVLGVFLGIPILYFVPSMTGQLLLTIIFGVCFFYLRSKKYAMATLMATLMVLLIFNLKGAGYSVILPRIIDTLLGCLIAWFAVSFIWPDWNFRNISRNIRQSNLNSMAYFDEVVQQYLQGRNNHTAYRKARRYAHNAQIELSNMISSLSTEPHPNAELIQQAFRYLVYSHSQLSYIAALGSHRQYTAQTAIRQLLINCQQLLQHSVVQQQPLDEQQLQQLSTQIAALSFGNDHDEHILLVLKQLSLLLETLPEFLLLQQQLLAWEIR
ncbi:YccS family putative transporter [Acinetobacter larvae]|uniref:TIGR01666 family membrane protein n=1 Tax=Acinetobacter larvae TaxID=1789224 RepID=A0A1B2M2C7_9GAMM|nr:YccS family putative transporter [Acinetobacter larvae]AOA59356.1 TIGR01666 family membrane protein [Acinetobacter larvae]